ncbi:MAG: hypothetical protein Q9160_005250 [Pyrenula sp. 1 TL-2023]
MSSNTSPKLTWLITGCSSGIGIVVRNKFSWPRSLTSFSGFALALSALKAGHNVIASSRNPSKSPAQVKEIESQPNGRWISLDITAADLSSTLSEAERHFGGIDILVNNAGYALMGALEDIPESQARAQMDTNFFGPLRLMQAALPGMRARGLAGRQSTIVNLSSVGGLNAVPTAGLYAASKHALEAISESLSKEVAAFGIRILIVEPGAIRTQFLTSTNVNFTEPSTPYQSGVAGQTLETYKSMDGKQGGSPEKAAQAIFDVVMGSGRAQGKRKVLRLLQGKDCHQRVRAKVQNVIDDLEEMEDLDVAFD